MRRYSAGGGGDERQSGPGGIPGIKFVKSGSSSFIHQRPVMINMPRVTLWMINMHMYRYTTRRRRRSRRRYPAGRRAPAGAGAGPAGGEDSTNHHSLHDSSLLHHQAGGTRDPTDTSTVVVRPYRRDFPGFPAAPAAPAFPRAPAGWCKLDPVLKAPLVFQNLIVKSRTVLST